MRKNIKQLRNEFHTIANEHLQINDFYFGSFLDAYSGARIQHTILMLDILQSTPGREANQGNYYVDLLCVITVADKVYDDDSNRIDVQNQTHLIINDVWNTLQSKKWTRDIGKIISTTPAQYFRQKGGDNVDGWVIQFTLRIWSDRDLCAIPYNDYDFEN